MATDWNKLLREADGFIILYQKAGDVKAKLEGNYQVIFDRLFYSEKEKRSSDTRGEENSLTARSKHGCE